MAPLSPADYNSLVLSRLSSADYEVVGTKLQPLGALGFSIFAEFSVLRLSVKPKSSGAVSELSFIVKIPPGVETCADFVSSIRAFYKEPLVYNRILKDLNDHITGKVGPDCFLAQPEKAIVLDNVFDLGYRKVDIKREFNLHHCELVLDALAKLHASSLILEEKKSSKLPAIYPHLLFETVFSDETNHPGFDFMCTGINTLETLFTTHFTHFPRNVIKETMTLVRNLPFKLKPSVDYKNVLNHGGVWAENALFAYGIDGNPTDVRLIDFSNARYAPPACDVLMFLHMTTSRAFRELHQGALLTHYYSQLAKEVKEKGFDLGDLLPWTEFEASVQHYLGAAIVGSLMHIHVTLLPEDILMAVTKDSNALTAFMFEDRSERVLSAYSYDESYRRRLSQALVQALEYTQFRGRRRSSVYISA
uniref:CHK kinase-like domain-containing protein n=1 Tax=Graphocephala atropunctata TaxID=36148 RepID=A0A1B6LX59_9HEMI